MRKKKLNSLIAEYRLLKTEEEKKGFDEKMRHTLSEISPEERKKFRNAFLISARQTLAKAKELKEEAEIKLLLNGVDNYLSLSPIAQDYFGKSRSWLLPTYQWSLSSTANPHSLRQRNGNSCPMPY